MNRKFGIVSILIIGFIIQSAYGTESTYKVKACDNEGLDPNAGLFSSDDEKGFLSRKNALIKGDNLFKTALIDKDNTKAQEDIVANYIAPIAIMIIILVLTFPLGYCCYYWCACPPDRCCPPCKCCCKKCLCCECDRKEPYTGFSRLYPYVGMLAFLLWILVSAIVGLAQSGGMTTSYKKFRCSAINFFDVMNYGDKAKWGGIQSLSTKLVDLSSKIDQMVTDIQTQAKGCVGTTDYSGNLCLETQFNALNDFTTEQVPFTVTSTNSLETLISSTAVDLDSIFDSSFKYLGAYDPSLSTTIATYSGFFGEPTPGTSFYKSIIQGILTEITTQTIANMKSAIDSVAISTADMSGASYKDAISSGSTQVNNVMNQITTTQKDADDFLQNGLDGQKLITTILSIIFGVFIGLAVLLIVVGAIMFFFEKNKCRIILHLCWMFFTLITALGLLISIVLYMVSLFGFNFCDYVGYDVLRWNDPTNTSPNSNFDKLNDSVFKLNGDTYKMFKECFGALGGEGKIMKSFGIQDQLSSLNTVSTKNADIQTYTTKLAEVSTNITSLSQYLIDIFENCETTVNGNVIKEHALLDGAVTALNTDYTTTTYHDTFNVKLPTSFTSVQYEASTGLKIPYAYSTSAKDWWLGNTFTFSGSDYLTRNAFSASDNKLFYVSPSPLYAKYQSVGGLVHDSFTQLFNFLTIKDAVTRNRTNMIIGASPSYKSHFDAISTKINSAVSGLNTFMTSFQTTINSITDPTTGIVGDDTTDCKFVEVSINNVLKSICWGYFVNIYDITKALIFISVGMSLSSFFMCCAAMKASKNDLLKNQKQAQAKIGPNN